MVHVKVGNDIIFIEKKYLEVPDETLGAQPDTQPDATNEPTEEPVENPVIDSEENKEKVSDEPNEKPAEPGAEILDMPEPDAEEPKEIERPENVEDDEEVNFSTEDLETDEDDDCDYDEDCDNSPKIPKELQSNKIERIDDEEEPEISVADLEEPKEIEKPEISIEDLDELPKETVQVSSLELLRAKLKKSLSELEDIRSDMNFTFTSNDTISLTIQSIKGMIDALKKDQES